MITSQAQWPLRLLMVAAVTGAVAVTSTIAEPAPSHWSAASQAADRSSVPGPAINRFRESAPSRPAITASENASGCQRVRKRLWVESEGWIVRRVTSCL